MYTQKLQKHSEIFVLIYFLVLVSEISHSNGYDVLSVLCQTLFQKVYTESIR